MMFPHLLRERLKISGELGPNQNRRFLEPGPLDGSQAYGGTRVRSCVTPA